MAFDSCIATVFLKVKPEKTVANGHKLHSAIINLQFTFGPCFYNSGSKTLCSNKTVQEITGSKIATF